jgi:hypothetical protein
VSSRTTHNLTQTNANSLRSKKWRYTGHFPIVYSRK